MCKFPGLGARVQKVCTEQNVNADVEYPYTECGTYHTIHTYSMHAIARYRARSIAFHTSSSSSSAHHDGAHGHRITAAVVVGNIWHVDAGYVGDADDGDGGGGGGGYAGGGEWVNSMRLRHQTRARALGWSTLHTAYLKREHASTSHTQNAQHACIHMLRKHAHMNELARTRAMSGACMFVCVCVM